MRLEHGRVKVGNRGARCGNHNRRETRTQTNAQRVETEGTFVEPDVKIHVAPLRKLNCGNS
jgi:hypothetical protein